MTVHMFGSSPDDVGIYSFRLRDAVARIFTMDFPDETTAQLTAESYYARQGTYDTVQPGITAQMVFVFLVPSDVSGLSAERCATNGCDAGGPQPGSAPAGCTLIFASFYTEPNEFCGTNVTISQVTTIPGSGSYDSVSAPAGTKFAVVQLSVENYAYAPDDVGSYSLRMRDSQSNIYTMDFANDITIQLTAQSYYGRWGTYDTIQPGIAADLVLVFLVPSSASGLTVERCSNNGCS